MRKEENSMALKFVNPVIIATMNELCKRDENGNVVKDVVGQPVLDEEKWLGLRKEDLRVGGSETAMLTATDGSFGGCSKWGNPFTLAREKTGVAETIEDSDKEGIFFVGHWMEEPVAERAGEMIKSRLGLPVNLINDTRMFQCGIKNEDGTLRYPHAIADCDRMLHFVGVPAAGLKAEDGALIHEWEGLEIKTTRIIEAWDPADPHTVEGVPAYYYMQIQHYMAVTGLPVFWIAVQDLKDLSAAPIIRRVERNDELCEKILDNIEFFVREVKSGNLFDSPEYAEENPTSYNKLSARWADPAPVTVDVPQSLLDEWQAAQDDVTKANDGLVLAQMGVEVATEKRTAVENKIGALFKNHEGTGLVTMPDGTTVKIVREVAKGRSTFDLDRMKKEAPALYDRIVTFEPKAIAYSKLKGDDKAEAAKFRMAPVKRDSTGEVEGWTTKVVFPKPAKTA